MRDLGERATQAETQIETYKKKLEEASVLRRQLGTIQAQNEEYVSTIVELEEVRRWDFFIFLNKI